MARKKREAAPGTRVPAVDPVQSHELPARQLVTVPPDAPIWTARLVKVVMAEGALVRMLPPADATAERIEQLRQEFRQAGALAVVVLPRAPGAKAVPDAIAPAGDLSDLAPRAVVMAMAAELGADHDQRAVTMILDAALSAAGL